MSEPNAKTLTAAADAAIEATPEVKRQFILVLQDNPETGMLDVAGSQAPAEFDGVSPAHIVGKFIADNLDAIIAAAANDVARGLGVAALAQAPEVARPPEKTIILPAQDSQAVAS